MTNEFVCKIILKSVDKKFTFEDQKNPLQYAGYTIPPSGVHFSTLKGHLRYKYHLLNFDMQ